MERKCLLKVALQIQEKNKNDFVHSDWLPSNWKQKEKVFKVNGKRWKNRDYRVTANP